ncbi:MAG TPA: MBL fold metallo-hydrolase [Solirubrobacteraceae bacterium]|nr:MBL fold metallo-hydrolase [Solirubrobacteraceae bacterium]
MFFRQLLNDETACASYVLGCPTKGRLAVVDPHIDLIEDYLAAAERAGASIVAVIDTHRHADHVSGMGELVARTGATAYPPEAITDRQVIDLGNTEMRAVATPGHAPTHWAFVVTDYRRADEPWLVLTGDSLLVNDAGRPDLHAREEHTPEHMARILYRSITERLLTLPDDLLVYPGHYSGSLCGRGLSGHPASTIGFERRHNKALGHADADAFAAALVEDMPPAPVLS